MPDLLDRLKVALADRYGIERELCAGETRLWWIGRHKGLKSQPNNHVGKRYDAVVRVVVPHVTV